MFTRLEFNRSVAFLRKQFTWSETYREVIKRCSRGPGILQCEGCNRLVSKSEEAKNRFLHLLREFDSILEEDLVSLEKFAVDHIDPVGTLSGASLDEAVEKIFCKSNNLMGLCGSCHYFKTRIDMEEIRNRKNSLLDRIEQGQLDDSNK